jgi:hypothetical protein
MDGVFFPITTATFAADLTVTDLVRGRIPVRRRREPRSTDCDTPGTVWRPGLSMAVIPWCMSPITNWANSGSMTPTSKVFLAFRPGADVLIHDTTYFDDEYPRKANWGHSSVSQVVRLAGAANVHRLYLFHHDPGARGCRDRPQTRLRPGVVGRLGLSLECAIAVEGEGFDLASGHSIPAR